MKKIAFNLLVLFVLASFVLSACGGAATAAPAATEALLSLRLPLPPKPLRCYRSPVCGDLEGEVAIVAWAGYIERGATDPAYDWVTEFEAETSCKVTVKTAATSDEMVALMNEGGFDLVTASGDASNRLIAGGRVQEIDLIQHPQLWTRLTSACRMLPGTRWMANIMVCLINRVQMC